ncbi:response regulator [Candidatus Entotheonella palauensis]|uniref:Fis family transcriptional regulator n=1 Tax=Candidatus Entotheonella gemina TaxID=1429439 RepID=W4MDK6_9BACT|nr:response regulator [Candidatus Entotheonella palauensis]ETX08016.1 MAG: Fis family transcriptional regulator [Candidatus Entotheonella gemina]
MTPKTLLLVEDSFTIQKLVESTFTSAGYHVAIANDAREGLAKLPMVSPDIVLADASMPEMDGFQLCQTIRSTQGFERIPVLLLTSRFAAYDEIQGQRSGVTGYLAKPFDSYSLLSLVQQLIDQPPPATTGVWDPTTSDAQAEELTLPVPGNGEIAPNHAIHPPGMTDLSGAPMPQAYEDLTATLSHIIQETVQSYLVTLLDSLTPHIVEEVRTTVDAKIPELLEALLQREIDQLKQVAAQDEGLGEDQLS